MLQPNVIVHLKAGSTVQTEGGAVEEIDCVAGRALFETDEVRDDELVEQTIISGQNGDFTVDDSDIEEIQRL